MYRIKSHVLSLLQNRSVIASGPWGNSEQDCKSCAEVVAERNCAIAPGKDGSTVRYVGTILYASIFAKKFGTPFLERYGYATLVRYAFLEMVQVRYVGTLFEFAY